MHVPLLRTPVPQQHLTFGQSTMTGLFNCQVSLSLGLTVFQTMGKNPTGEVSPSFSSKTDKGGTLEGTLRADVPKIIYFID